MFTISTKAIQITTTILRGFLQFEEQEPSNFMIFQQHDTNYKRRYKNSYKLNAGSKID